MYDRRILIEQTDPELWAAIPVEAAPPLAAQPPEPPAPIAIQPPEPPAAKAP